MKKWIILQLGITVLLVVGMSIASHQYGVKSGINKTEIKYKTIADTTSYKIPTEAWILDGDFPRKVKFYEVIWERPELKEKLDSLQEYPIGYWEWHQSLKIESLFATKEDACKMAKARIQAMIKFEQDKLNQIDCNNK